jgi:outer membrane protein OmpA-like peptidoglycan-associated protein
LEVLVTRFSLLLVACTATLGLAAGQSAQEQSKSSFKPVELQIGASFVGYDPQEALGINGSGTFSPKGLGLAPSFRFTFEPIALPFGGLAFTAGYRLGNDVPLEYGTDAKADLQHKSQLSLGALVRVGVTENFDLSAGFETRNDWMYASEIFGTETEHSVWRPWLRFGARYLFDRGTNITPFVGAEASFALTPVEVNPWNYYHDYAMNTGDMPLGRIDFTKASPESFAKGNMPLYEFAAVIGVRFGRHGYCGAAPAPKAAKVKEPKPPKAEKPKPEKKPEPVVDKKPEPVVEKTVEKVVEKKAEEPITVVVVTPEPEKPPPVAEKVVEKVEKKAEVIEIEGIRIHFVTNDAGSSEANNRTIVKNWAAKYKNVVDPKALLVTGHADKRGSHAHNLALSTRRANTLAGYLRAEGVNVPAANVKGRSWDEPIADNDTPEGLAKNRRAELGVNAPNYKIKSMMEGNIVGHN